VLSSLRFPAHSRTCVLHKSTCTFPTAYRFATCLATTPDDPIPVSGTARTTGSDVVVVVVGAGRGAASDPTGVARAAGSDVKERSGRGRSGRGHCVDPCSGRKARRGQGIRSAAASRISALRDSPQRLRRGVALRPPASGRALRSSAQCSHADRPLSVADTKNAKADIADKPPNPS
jgi:hypothetical protein